MNCPFCGEPMEKGDIYGRRDAGLMWLPENEDWPRILTDGAVAKRNRLVLGGDSMLFPKEPTRLETHICKKCRKGVISY